MKTYILKVEAKNIENSKKNTAQIVVDLYFEFEIKFKKMNILGYDYELKQGTQIQFIGQPSWKEKDPRKYLKNIFPNKKFGFNKTKRATKPDPINLNSEELIKINNLEHKKTFLVLFGHLSGCNFTGSEAKINASPLVTIIHFQEKRFFNLLKVFTTKKNIFRNFKIKKFLNTKKIINLDEFYNKYLNINEQNVYNFFMNKQEKYFVIREEKKALGNINGKSKKNGNFLRRNFHREYGKKLLDHLYKMYSQSNVVEACHIIPIKILKNKKKLQDIKKHIEKNKQYFLDDINNGLLLPIHIHRLLDSKKLTFSDKGKPICSNQITKSEKKIMKLEEVSLDKKVLTLDRLKILKYHREHIYNK